MPGSTPLWNDTAALRRLVRFGAVGVLNTAFSYGVFATLILAGLHPLPALVLNTVASLAFNFQTSRRLVFRSGATGRLPRFLLVYAVIIGLNWLALHALGNAGIPPLYAQAALVIPIAALSYLGQHLFVFGTAQKDNP